MKLKTYSQKINRARKEKLSKTFYFGQYLPMIESTFSMKYDFKSNKYY
jgi:hypothetical protein